MNDLEINRLVEFLKRVDKVAIVFHKNPDGDALGSALALCLGLRQLNKSCRILSFEKIPERFGFMFENFVNDEFENEILGAVDLASPSLIEDKIKKKVSFNFLIDHHATNNLKADFKFIDSYAAATCELVYSILIRLGVEITQFIAMSLYVGIVTDTGCFRFKNTTARTHKIASSLLETGINFHKINFDLFGIRTYNQLSLQNLAFEGLQFFFDGRCAIVYITTKMFQLCGCSQADFFIVVDLVSSVEGVEFAIAAKQISNGCFKFSVRTKNGFNAAGFCEQFSGGGHENAAGFEMQGEITLIKQEVLKKVEEFLFEGNSLH